MPHHELNAETIEEVQLQLDRLAAKCNPSTKARQGAPWVSLRESVDSFGAALAVAIGEAERAAEVAVFLVHLKYGGIMIWSSVAPDMVNDFSDWT